MQKKKKNSKMYFDFWNISFELVALNTRFYWDRVLVIGCEYVNKQCQELKNW